MILVLDKTADKKIHAKCLTAEAVQGAALALEGVHDVKSSDGLAASMLGVGHGVTDDIV